MQQLRRDGQIFMSSEIVQVTTLIAGFLALNSIWLFLLEDLRIVLYRSYRMIGDGQPLTIEKLQEGFAGLVMLLAPEMFFLMLIIAMTASLAVMLQTKWNVKQKKVHFRWNFLNPINGVKRIVSVQGAMNTLKAILKLCLILPIAYYALRDFAPRMTQLVHMSVGEVMAFAGQSCMTIFWKVMYILIALAIFDYFWGRKQWLKNVMMTKEEVKEERKASEGDESTKRRIISKGLQRIAQRIMQSVPKADVVVTNPTHFAVALKYDRAKNSAPIVVAKGQGFLALRIREIAKQSGVPILERKQLARALYKSTEVGSEIPRDLFKAVAEVLAYVYKLRPGRYRAPARSS